ncbi:hypothetical protein EVAR_101902_1 [Eumeta japonica]|uniref:Uncharacterized protein n=1 Tax=Eumeta variegata TaxID=151549 RepID=A0A4C1T3Q4_EUMVA|nr:hypothetical protein EVAR_101902_1 [Eumeta japonica]
MLMPHPVSMSKPIVVSVKLVIDRCETSLEEQNFSNSNPDGQRGPASPTLATRSGSQVTRPSGARWPRTCELNPRLGSGFKTEQFKTGQVHIEPLAVEIPADQLQAASVLADRCWELSRGQTDKQVTGWTDEHGETIREPYGIRAGSPRAAPAALFLEIEILLKKRLYSAIVCNYVLVPARGGPMRASFRTFARRV